VIHSPSNLAPDRNPSNTHLCCTLRAVFADFSEGHYTENTSATENLVWIEIFKSDRVADISFAQWLALILADIRANTLRIPGAMVQQLKKQKQLLIQGPAVTSYESRHQLERMCVRVKHS
jgi:hypothetical protein